MFKSNNSSAGKFLYSHLTVRQRQRQNKLFFYVQSIKVNSKKSQILLLLFFLFCRLTKWSAEKLFKWLLFLLYKSKLNVSLSGIVNGIPRQRMFSLHSSEEYTVYYTLEYPALKLTLIEWNGILIELYWQKFISLDCLLDKS